MKTSIKMELPPLKLYKFYFKLMLRQASTTKTLFHPLPFLWCIILRWPCGLAGITISSPITNSCGANLCTTPLCNAQWKKRRGGGEREREREREWQTATGKINRNIVSSWVLMSTTQSPQKKYKWAERKNEERESCKILTVSTTPPSATPTVTA